MGKFFVRIYNEFAAVGNSALAKWGLGTFAGAAGLEYQSSHDLQKAVIAGGIACLIGLHLYCKTPTPAPPAQSEEAGQ